MFINSGDVNALSGRVIGTSPCTVAVEEFVRGSRNQFIIEPKSVRIWLCAARRDHCGRLPGHGRVSDRDLLRQQQQLVVPRPRRLVRRTINPVVYDVQQVSMPSTKLTDSVVLYLKDYYLTPYSNIKFYTPSFTSGGSAREVQIAIESLANVDSLDVTKQTSSSGGVYFCCLCVERLYRRGRSADHHCGMRQRVCARGAAVRLQHPFQLQFSYMGAATPVTLTQCAVHCGIHLSRQTCSYYRVVLLRSKRHAVASRCDSIFCHPVPSMWAPQLCVLLMTLLLMLVHQLIVRQYPASPVLRPRTLTTTTKQRHM